MNEGTLGVHEVELVIQTAPCICDSGGVGEHTDGTVDVSHSSVGDLLGLLVVDSQLETSRAPLNQVEGGLGLDGSHGLSTLLGNNITTVQQSDGHVLAIARVTDDHLVVRLEA